MSRHCVILIIYYQYRRLAIHISKNCQKRYSSFFSIREKRHKIYLKVFSLTVKGRRKNDDFRYDDLCYGQEWHRFWNNTKRYSTLRYKKTFSRSASGQGWPGQGVFGPLWFPWKWNRKIGYSRFYLGWLSIIAHI